MRSDRGVEDEGRGERETAGRRRAAKKKKQSPATGRDILANQTDTSGNSSLLPGQEEALLTHSVFLLNPGIKSNASPFFFLP